MALHRDIFWIGKQWAVTGYGVQAVDQRLKGAFDVEAACLWDDDLPQRMRALAWINSEDFDKALDQARTRFPAPPPRKNLPLVESVLELIQPSAREAPKAAPLPAKASLPEILAAEAGLPQPADPEIIEMPIELPPEVSTARAEPLAMRIEHASAKFVPRWRVRSHSQ